MSLRVLPLLAAFALAVVAVPVPAAALECVGVDGECVYPPVVCVTQPCGPAIGGDGWEARPGPVPAYQQPVCVTEPCGPWVPYIVQELLKAAWPCIVGTAGSCALPIPEVDDPVRDLPDAPLPPVKPLPCVFGSDSRCLVGFDCVQAPCEPEHIP